MTQANTVRRTIRANVVKSQRDPEQTAIAPAASPAAGGLRRTQIWCIKEPATRVATTVHQQLKEITLAKGLEQKKETKKKPAQTLKEKKADKTAKKAGK